MAIADYSETDTRETQWPELRRRIARAAKRRHYEVLWPAPENPGVGRQSAARLSAVRGRELLWGLAASGGPIRTETLVAARIAGGAPIGSAMRVRATSLSGTELATAIEDFVERLERWTPDSSYDLGPSLLGEAVVWGYAMPPLALDFVGDLNDDLINEDLWWTLLGALQTVRQNAHEQLAPAAPERLLLAGELAAVLAWQLADLPSCGGLKVESLEAIGDWFDESGDAVSAALENGGQLARLTLASAIRSRRLAARLKRPINLKRCGAAVDLATWAAAMLRGDGSVVLGPITDQKTEVAADCGPDGLFETASREFGGPALQTAVQASLGKTKSEGRLAWQVQLPEPGWFDESAGLTVMLPEWDVRRGRVALTYSGSDTGAGRVVRLEISGGKSAIISGDWPIDIWCNENQLSPTGPWNDVCWYSDDDVHYLELEQAFSNNVRVQRQVLMIRDDRCLMLADAVLAKPGEVIRYQTQLPLAETVHVEEERETREVYLVDGKRRALLMPVALSEWKVGPTAGTLRIEDANVGMQVAVEVRGSGSLYSPLWLDLDRRRIRAQKTWRALTIGQQRELVPKHEAAAFRVQVGGDQWVVYRSLNGPHNRTFLGKNLISDFYCGRFDADDGSIEEMVSVDEQPD